MKNTLKVTILGTNFTIQSDEDREYLEQVLFYLKKKVQEVQAKFPDSEPIKIALLAALNIIDELFKLRRENTHSDTNHETRIIENITQSLIDKIDDALME